MRAGQFTGIITLIVISLIGSLAGVFINQSYIGTPWIVSGLSRLKGIWELLKERTEDNSIHNWEGKSSGNKILNQPAICFREG